MAERRDVMKIDAAVLRDAAGAYAIESVEISDPGPGQVLVRVVGTGMCHTDVVPRAGADLVGPPIITGHEGAGVVEAVGPGVTSVAAGDHVCMSFDSCGQCSPCRAHNPAYCDEFMARNLTGRNVDGSAGVTDHNGETVLGRWFGQSSFATYAIGTARNVVPVDKGLPLEKLGPLGCGVQTGAGSILVAMNVQPGTSLVVFGTGAVGLSAVMAAKVAEAEQIIAVDLHDHRLRTASELGATHTVRGDAEDLPDQLREITNGGANYTFDTTGMPPVMRTAMDVLRMTGVCGYVGVQLGDLVLDSMSIVGKTMLGILEGSADPQQFIPHLIELWQAGRFPFDRLIEEFPMSHINEAEQASLSGRVIKPVLVPGS
jgi:aryl-alcohol dehydrogenase